MPPDPSPADPPGRWTVVLPVQRAERAKTRLRPDRPAISRPNLARAIAADSLAAVRSCREVGRRLVVTSDAVTAADCHRLGDDVLPDPGAGLDAAVRAGVRAALCADQHAAVAVLLPDVPALRPQDLQDALRAAAAHALSVVPDAEGTGTVLLCGRPGGLVRVAFGPRSAGRHERLGAVRLPLALPHLRRDVDTWATLVAAGRLGLGPATRAVLAGLPLRPEPDPP